MKEDPKYRFFITTQAGQVEMFPQNTNSLHITWVKQNNTAYFRKTLTGKIKFVEADFNKLYVQERSIYRCNAITLLINKNCEGYAEFFNGRMLCDDGDWDIDHCEVEIQASSQDLYTCYDDNKDVEFNLFSYIAHGEHVNTLRGTIEILTCHSYTYPPVDWCGDGDNPYEQGWTILSVNAVQDPPSDSGPSNINQTIVWIRERLETVEIQPAPWILISATPDGLVTDYVYVRAPALFDKVSTPDGPRSTIYIWKYGAKWQNGMKLYDVMNFLVTNMCPGLTVVSDFFQWNPINVSTVNYQTGEDSKVLNLILFQKSDVKRPPTESDIALGFAEDDAATDATTSLDPILQDICVMFKLQWWIEDDSFRIEHVSYFNTVLGLDLILARDDSKYRIGKTAYNYKTDSLPHKEIFNWMDKSGPGEFSGTDIIYQSTCSGISDKNNKNNSVQHITTDVQLCLDNPESDSSIVDDEGFVIMACDDENSLLYQPPIIGGHQLNNTLAWSSLQQDYWRYNTYFEQFLLNNEIQNTQKIIPNKSQQGVIAVICCGEDFDPDKLVKTAVGIGEVEVASLNLFTDMLTLNLLFDQNEGLLVNDAPVATGSNERTPKNTDITIDVLVHASDSDGTINPATLEIVTGPAHGTAVITMDNKITYSPAVDYIGGDSFVWRVKDDLNQPSNNATETIVVYQPAVAVDDAFKIARNKTLFNAAYRLLANDSGTGSLSCVVESKPTAHGNVDIFADGTFRYIPALDYDGVDTFDYTMKDANADTDIGTVTITVFIPVPVFVHLVKDNTVVSNVVDICTGGPRTTGTQTTKDFIAHFYSDAGGTIPLDVTGYEDDLLSNGHTVINGTPSDSAGSNVISGFTLFIGNFKTIFIDNGCDGSLNYHRTFDITLVASPDYTII